MRFWPQSVPPRISSGYTGNCVVEIVFLPRILNGLPNERSVDPAIHSALPLGCKVAISDFCHSKGPHTAFEEMMKPPGIARSHASHNATWGPLAILDGARLPRDPRQTANKRRRCAIPAVKKWEMSRLYP